MTVFMIETFVIKPEKVKEYLSMLEEIFRYRKENPAKFKEMKSWKVFKHRFGGNDGGYVEMIEFDSLGAIETFGARAHADEEYMKLIRNFNSMIYQTTYSKNIWLPVK